VEKLEPTLDKRCGSESGYSRHRRSNEHKCQPCKDAHNIYRRATYNPEVNRKHAEKYRKAHSEVIKERHKKYAKHVDPEVKEARKAARKAAIEARTTPEVIEARREKANETQRKWKQANKEKVALRQKEYGKKNRDKLREKGSARRAKYRAEHPLPPRDYTKFIEGGKNNFIAANAKKSVEAAVRNQIKREISERRRLIKRLITLINRRIAKLNKVKRGTNRTLLANQHGTGPGDYDRCRKNNGVACAPCKAAAAKYAREKFHSDPKYKEAEKRWRQANPHKTYRDHKDRALKHGGKHQYYTRQHIFDRDGYDCYLCQTPVDLTAPHIQGQPGWETYPHIEHVIPLSKGGDDTLENVKIAHAKCNVDKGTKIYQATA